MQFDTIHTYQQSADEVFAALIDFEAVKSKYEAIGRSDVVLVRRDDGDDGSVTMVTTRVVPARAAQLREEGAVTQTARHTDRRLVRS